MSRRYKPNLEESFYHITVRTVQKAYLLREPDVKEAWTAKLKQLASVYYVEVLSYVVMSNHIHIVLKMMRPKMELADLRGRYEVLQKVLVGKNRWYDWRVERTYGRFTDLSKIMHDLNQRTAAWHNKSRKTSGHFWGRRFYSKIIGNDQHLLTTIAYSDLNPVRGNLVKWARDYPFGSAGELQARLDRGETPQFPAIGFLKFVEPNIRAGVYLSWLDYLTAIERHEDHPRASLQGFSVAIDKAGVDMDEVRRQLTAREPANWRRPVFASSDYIKGILKQQGWLAGPVPKSRKEATQKGSSIKELPLVE